jgi:hypothetical protein
LIECLCCEHNLIFLLLVWLSYVDYLQSRFDYERMHLFGVFMSWWLIMVAFKYLCFCVLVREIYITLSFEIKWHSWPFNMYNFDDILIFLIVELIGL